MAKQNALTSMEKKWVLYDVGNSAFSMLVSTIIPIYFKNTAAAAGISDADSTAWWSYAISLSTIIIAVLGPTLGALADTKGYKKPLFTLFMLLGVLGCAGLAIPVGWVAFLGIFTIARVGFSGSLIFYDSMLTDITDDDRMDKVSSHGYAWGYIGSCVPFVISLLLVLFAENVGLTTGTATMIAFVINAVWWLAVTLPLLESYKQVYGIERSRQPLKESFGRLWGTLKAARKEKAIFLFLLAFFFYIDGVYTIIDLATSYGKDVGIDDTSLLLALLLTQVVAFPCVILFSWLTKKVDSKKLITVCIAGYFFIACFAIQLDTAWEFWFLAVCVAVFQGSIQSLSRSYFAKIIPKEKSNEYFGFFDIFGKGAAFVGTMVVGISTQLSGTSRTGVILIAVMFVVGWILFRAAVKESEKSNTAKG